MALTVKHLNGDASFLLTFEPILPIPVPGLHPEPFRILLDPWITGPSKIFHSKISMTVHKEAACISSLRELPEPDLVIISQHKSDHCNETTLKQLPPTGTRTIILAEPGSARTIRSWRYFDKEKVRSIPKWEDPRITGRQRIVRISLPPLVQGGETGEVTVAYIPQRRDLSGLHAAIGITYRPPTARPLFVQQVLRRSIPWASTPIATPPETPRSHRSHVHPPGILTSTAAHQAYTSDLSPSTPTSPGLSSLRSVRSTSNTPSLPSHGLDRPLSVLFSPHGISYPSLHSYTTSHLVAEAALPLTALLHCFDSVSNPWWLGGNILLGAPAGTETAGRLRAKAWISAHDGDKEVKGIATGLLRTRKWRKEEVMGGLNASEVALGLQSTAPGLMRPGSRIYDRLSRGMTTEVLSLGTGQEVVLTSDGVWNVEKPSTRLDSVGLAEGKEDDERAVGERAKSFESDGAARTGLTAPSLKMVPISPLPPLPVAEEAEELEEAVLRGVYLS
ncbi:hypothetical protein GQ53DRAFT_662793 [Thozetella sp. PMI_491]|nr:hypothetical protein GQ53DRAFT_662793 [Thozetella sp. PMI_491]